MAGRAPEGQGNATSCPRTGSTEIGRGRLPIRPVQAPAGSPTWLAGCPSPARPPRAPRSVVGRVLATERGAQPGPLPPDLVGVEPLALVPMLPLPRNPR